MQEEPPGRLGGAAPASSAPTVGPRRRRRRDPLHRGARPQPPGYALYAQQVRWEQCADDDDFDCASVTVPLASEPPGRPSTSPCVGSCHRRRPRGRCSSTPAARDDPASSSSEPAPSAPSCVRRGTSSGSTRGGSVSQPGFDCVTDDELGRMYAADPTPPSPQGGVPEEAAAARVDGCLQRGGPLAANMGSEAVAADLDILREAVGDERLNYYGVSYGTLIEAIYADRFTSRVRLAGPRLRRVARCGRRPLRDPARRRCERAPLGKGVRRSSPSSSRRAGRTNPARSATTRTRLLRP